MIECGPILANISVGGRVTAWQEPASLRALSIDKEQGMDKSHRGVWRRYPRVIPELPRPVVAELAGGARIQINDISEGGAELEWPRDSAPAVGALLHLDLILPLGEPSRLCVEARVRHAEPGRIGVAFADLDAGAQDRLAAYLAQERRERSIGRRLRRWYQTLLEGPLEGEARQHPRAETSLPQRRQPHKSVESTKLP